jgi:hypothetical protein
LNYFWAEFASSIFSAASILSLIALISPSRGSRASRVSSGIVTPLLACGPAGGSVAKGMKKISYRGYRFPPEIIQQAICSGSH